MELGSNTLRNVSWLFVKVKNANKACHSQFESPKAISPEAVFLVSPCPKTFSHFTTEHASIQCLRCAQEKLYVSADILELVQHLGNETNMAPAICLKS